MKSIFRYFTVVKVINKNQLPLITDSKELGEVKGGGGMLWLLSKNLWLSGKIYIVKKATLMFLRHYHPNNITFSYHLKKS